MENKIYKNTNIKNNNLKNSYGADNFKKEDSLNINKKINNIFKSNKFVYKLELLITINGRKNKECIIAKGSNFLLTLKNRKIFFKEIQDIHEIL